MFKFRNKKIERKKKQFRNLVNLGLQIYNENPNALQPYINGLARKVQYQRFVDFASSDIHAAPWNEKNDFFGQPMNSISIEEIISIMREDAINHTINLATDVVVPQPWKHSDFINCMTFYGEPEKAWKEVTTNHKGHTYLPSNISWIGGGNHSITTGYLKDTGSFKSSEVYNLNKIFNFIYSDGFFFWNKKTGRKISKVIFMEFAAIYEIERQVRRVQ